jgi:hypothetical protein
MRLEKRTGMQTRQSVTMMVDGLRTIAFGIIATCWSAGLAIAQAPAPKVFVVINGGYQFTSNDFTNGATKRENAEDGRFDTAYTVKKGPALDIAGGGTLWRRLGVGVGVSRFSVATPGAVTATIPHPFFFNRGRAVSGSAAGLKREEVAVHVQVRAIAPLGARFEAMVFGGPSFFQVKQGVVTDVTYTDAYPYDVATFRTATTNAASVSKMGFNVGGDLAFFFTRAVGLGGTVQFAGTTVELPAAGGAQVDLKVGGVKAGAGLRLRF